MAEAVSIKHIKNPTRVVSVDHDTLDRIEKTILSSAGVIATDHFCSSHGYRNVVLWSEKSKQARGVVFVVIPDET